MEFKVEFEVRDNEIDLQGIVNNTHYFTYMAHARHKYLKEVLNIDFVELTRKNLHIILLSSSIEYKRSLQPYDKFYVTCKMIPKGKIRFIFEQEFRLIKDNALIAKGINIGACMDKNINRPFIPEEISKVF